MNYKDKNKAPILVPNAEVGGWLNISGLFNLRERLGDSFPGIGNRVQHNVIRFINENCIVEDPKGQDAQDMFYILYEIMDMLNTIEEVKS